MSIHAGGRGPGHISRLMGGGFSPRSDLFGLDEPGVWYDPSDLSTLYQDAAGTIPVTAAGQTVGLVLDKSKGLALGPELVTNGDFSNGSTGWTLEAGWSIAGGVASYDGTNAPNTMHQTAAILAAGKSYRVSVTVTLTQGALLVRPSYVTSTGQYQINSSGTYSILLSGQGGSLGFVASLFGARFIGSIDNISVRELPGNHATQSTAASRPLLQQDATGRYYLLFDGTDDFLVTPTITPGTDKVQVFAGVRKLSDAAAGVVVEGSANATSNNGAFYVSAPNTNGSASYGFASRGTALGTAQSAAAAPITNVLTGIGDIAADTANLRINGTQVATSAIDQGTGNYLAYPLYIGRRGGTTLPFNGHLYGLIARFGNNLSDAQIAQAESWLNSKTGAY